MYLFEFYVCCGYRRILILYSPNVIRVWFYVFRLVLIKHNSPVRTYQYKVNVKT